MFLILTNHAKIVRRRRHVRTKKKPLPIADKTNCIDLTDDSVNMDKPDKLNSMNSLFNFAPPDIPN